jgi:hypothetical protein
VWCGDGISLPMPGDAVAYVASMEAITLETLVVFFQFYPTRLCTDLLCRLVVIAAIL